MPWWPTMRGAGHTAAIVLRRAVALVIVLIVCAGCADEPARAPDVIVVVVIDTLRADRLGCYGNERGLTPFLDSLASRGVVFENAYAPSPWTNPSVASLLASQHVTQHGVETLESVLAKDVVTLPEVLQAHGWATAGYSANPALSRQLGFAQGFRKYRNLPPSSSEGMMARAARAPAINRAALRWLDELPAHPRPAVFLYLQYMEPHTPYVPSAALVDEFFSGGAIPDAERANRYMLDLGDVPADVLRDINNLYDVEVLAADRGVRELFDELERRRLLEHALVVVTSDHGEGLGDHGFLTHGSTLYNAAIRIPLIVVPPGASKGRRVADVVSLVDIAPTILEHVGVGAPDSFVGDSLVSHLQSRNGLSWLSSLVARPHVPRGTTVSELLQRPFGTPRRENGHVRALIDGSHKLIARRDSDPELYDLRVDPAETHPHALGPARRAELEKTLADLVDRWSHSADAGAADTVELPAEIEETLRALGYGRE